MLAVEEQSCRGGCALATSRRLPPAGMSLEGQTKGPAPSLFTYDDHAGVQNTVVVPADDEDAAQKIADLYEAKVERRTLGRWLSTRRESKRLVSLRLLLFAIALLTVRCPIG